MNQSEQINELAIALAKAQGEMLPAVKDSQNPYFNSKYADLAAVWKACRQPLSKNGLSIVQTTEIQDDKIILVTTLLHSSGQWMKGNIPLEMPKDDVIEVDKYGKPKKRNKIQAMASAMTYTRRMAVSAIAGVAPDDDSDDDGESANLSIKHYSNDPKISLAQADELRKIFEECDPAYKKVIWGEMQALGFKSLEDLPLTVFAKFSKGAIKNRDDYQKKAQQND